MDVCNLKCFNLASQGADILLGIGEIPIPKRILDGCRSIKRPIPAVCKDRGFGNGKNRDTGRAGISYRSTVQGPPREEELCDIGGDLS
jgi:hypothetical protein